VFMDGRSNPHKSFENERRQQRANSSDDLRSQMSQIRNTPEYIALAVKVCKFMQIDVVVSAYEADGQVMHCAIPNSLIAVTGDSDLLAIGSHGMPVPPKLVIVDLWNGQSFRVIGLQAPDTGGELPLYDLYRKHGRIIFQLYAGCSGCDFTEHRSGIPQIGLATFVKLLNEIEDTPSAATLANSIWLEHQPYMYRMHKLDAKSLYRQ
jgi:5'-3' exonuclease